ncbi:MAG: Fe-S cluster assembly protein SufD [Pseudomonadota bacterium]|jgi:Fe-S cluster assembly protein SufD
MTSKGSKQLNQMHGGDEGAASSTSWVVAALAQAGAMQDRDQKLPVEVRRSVSEARTVWSKVLFPTPRVEGWKYTNTDVIAKGPFVLAAAQPIDGDLSALIEKGVIRGYERSSLLVFIDGAFSPEYSSLVVEPGVEVTRLREGGQSAVRVGSLGQHHEESFAALATALLSDCVVVRVQSGCSAQVPVQIVHVVTANAEGAVVTPRVFVEAGENARVTVVESHVGAPGVRYLSLPIAELTAEQGALIDYYKVQTESEKAFHVAGVTATQARNAQVRSQIFSFGGALVRNNAQSLLKGAGAQTLLNGLSLLAGSQHVDNTTLIHHIEPHAESREHFKGIYGGASKGVFSGTITVEKIAQKTNAFQSNQALLLSSDATIDSRPQLKIWADDVKCTHGATVGQLDAEALFYLRSRGIGREDAKAFLVHAFASEVLTEVSSSQVKQHIEQLITAKLQVI